MAENPKIKVGDEINVTLKDGRVIVGVYQGKRSIMAKPEKGKGEDVMTPAYRIEIDGAIASFLMRDVELAPHTVTVPGIANANSSANTPATVAATNARALAAPKRVAYSHLRPSENFRDSTVAKNAASTGTSANNIPRSKPPVGMAAKTGIAGSGPS